MNSDMSHAAFSVTDLEVPDYFTALNGIIGGGPISPGVVSFEVEWTGVKERLTVQNGETGFAGEFVHNTATLSWSAQNQEGFSFKAEPFSVGFAELGKVRNGRFV